MNLQQNIQYASLIKNQYLPPPLQMNYLSLFDIQVKMAKQFLDGTQSERIQQIKKRIKKFFDYGNGCENQKNKEIKPGNQTKIYPPFEVGSVKFRQNLEIDSKRLIIYGKTLKLEAIEKLFYGYISLDKIDDCNYKLQYPSQKMCKNILYQNVREKTTKVTNSIFNPQQIEWFQIQPLTQLNLKQTYARFSTNMDDILFRNDLYFQRLLGKVRQNYDIKRLQYEQSVKQMQETIEMKRNLKNKKKKFIFKPFKKNMRNDVSQSDTVYDEQRQRIRNNINFMNSRQSNFNFSRENNLFMSGQRNQQIYQNKYFQNINVSQIQPNLIQLQRSASKSLKRINSRDSSFQSLDFCSKDELKNRRNYKNKFPMRNILINNYRQRSMSPSFKNNKNLLKYADKNRFQNQKYQGNNQFFQIN